MTAKHAGRVHVFMTFFWLALVPPVLFTDLKNSIPVLVFISIYANVVGHWSAHQAAQAEKNSPSV